MRLHDDELDIDAAMVRRLVDEQFPAWRALPVRAVPVRGTVNAVFRLGDELTVRLPVRREPAEVVQARLEVEAVAAGELAASSPVPTPRPVTLGQPVQGYPMPWAVQTWVAGRTAEGSEVAGSRHFAQDLAGLISALRATDTRGRVFTGTGRGGDLQVHDAWVQECLSRGEGLLDVPHVRSIWSELRDLPREGQDVMTHGDLVPGNVLVDDGRLCGVIDGGGFAPADPALELVGAWHLLEIDGRAEVRDLLGTGDVEWARGMAWALVQAIGLVWYYRDSHPALSRTGTRTLHRILDVAGAAASSTPRRG